VVNGTTKFNRDSTFNRLRRHLVEEFAPTGLITEDFLFAQRKGKRNKLIISALAKAAETYT